MDSEPPPGMSAEVVPDPVLPVAPATEEPIVPEESPAPSTKTPTTTLEALATPEINTGEIIKEATILGTTVFNRTRNESMKSYDAISQDDTAAREALLAEKPAVRVFVEIDALQRLEDAEFSVGSGISLVDDSGIMYEVDGASLTEIIKIDGEMLICSVDGSPDPKPVPRAQLIDQVIAHGKGDILAAFSDNTSQQELMQFFLEQKQPGAEPPTAEQLDRMRSLIKDVVVGTGHSTQTLREMTRNAYPRLPIPKPTDPNIGDLESIQEENDRRQAIRDEVNVRLAGRTVATLEDMQYVFAKCGLTPGGMEKELDLIQQNVYSLDDQIARATSPGEKARLKEKKDVALATIQIIKAGQDRIGPTTLADHMQSLADGKISGEQMRGLTKAMESLDPTTLILLTSPETSVEMTAEQIKSAREQQEKIDKYLKTLGIAGGALALLIALGLVSGAKG